VVVGNHHGLSGLVVECRAYGAVGTVCGILSTCRPVVPSAAKCSSSGCSSAIRHNHGLLFVLRLLSSSNGKFYCLGSHDYIFRGFLCFQVRMETDTVLPLNRKEASGRQGDGNESPEKKAVRDG